MSNLIAPSSHVQLFPCSVGVTTVSGQSAVWVKSPRTGKVLTFGNGFQSVLPNRVWGRIVSAIAKGQHSVAFTRDELAVLAKLIGPITANVAPVCPAGMSGTHLDPSRRRFVA